MTIPEKLPTSKPTSKISVLEAIREWSAVGLFLILATLRPNDPLGKNPQPPSRFSWRYYQKAERNNRKQIEEMRKAQEVARQERERMAAELKAHPEILTKFRAVRVKNEVAEQLEKIVKEHNNK